MTTFLMRFTEILRQKKSPGRKGSFSEDYRTSYLVLSSSVGCHFNSVELDDPLPITPLNDFDLTSKC